MIAAHYCQFVAVSIVCAVPLGTALAAASEPTVPSRHVTTQDRALAEALFQDGKALIEEEQVEAACVKFEESQRLDPALGTLLHLATCYSQLGKTASAWGAFQTAIEMAHLVKDNTRESLARERVRYLEATLSRVNISAENPAPGMAIYVDQRALGRGSLGTALPFDPGHHLIEATAPGRNRWVQRIELGAGPVTLDVHIPVLRAAIAQRETEPVRATLDKHKSPFEKSSGFGSKEAGFVSLGVGGASVLLGGYFGVHAYLQNKDADRYCNGQTCTQAGLDGHAAARHSATWSNVGFGVGLLGLAAGSYLVWFHDGGEPRNSALWLRTGLGEASLGGAF